MAYGATPLDGSATPIPMSSAVSPGDQIPYAVQGGPKAVDGQGNTLVPVSMYTYDGNDATKGATGDAAVTGDTQGTISAKLRGLLKIFTDIWDNVNHRIKVDGSGVTQPTQDIEQSGYVSASTPPSATNAGSDTSYTFSSQVNRVILMNNTSANVNYAFDTAASAGSLLLVPGAMLVYPKKCTVLHLYTAAVQNINGSSGNNLVVLGAM